MVMQTCVRSSEPRPHLARQIPNIVNSLCLHHCLRQLFGAESSTRNGFQRRASDITKIFRLLNLFTASTMTATATKRTRSSNTTPFFSNANENTIDSVRASVTCLRCFLIEPVDGLTGAKISHWSRFSNTTPFHFFLFARRFDSTRHNGNEKNPDCCRNKIINFIEQSGTSAICVVVSTNLTSGSSSQG